MKYEDLRLLKLLILPTTLTSPYSLSTHSPLLFIFVLFLNCGLILNFVKLSLFKNKHVRYVHNKGLESEIDPQTLYVRICICVMYVCVCEGSFFFPCPSMCALLNQISSFSPVKRNHASHLCVNWPNKTLAFYIRKIPLNSLIKKTVTVNTLNSFPFKMTFPFFYLVLFPQLTIN